MKNVSSKKLLMGVASLSVLIPMAAFAANTGWLTPSSFGSYSQFDKVGSLSNYQNVDEGTCNGDSDYNYTTVVDERDSYTISLSGIPDGSFLDSIDFDPCMGKYSGTSGDGTNAVAAPFYRLNGVVTTATSTYTLVNTTQTNAGVKAMSLYSTIKGPGTTLQAGIKYNGCSGAGCTLRGMKISQMKVRIIYH
jgi:hypothetical protein